MKKWYNEIRDSLFRFLHSISGSEPGQVLTEAALSLTWYVSVGN